MRAFEFRKKSRGYNKKLETGHTEMYIYSGAYRGGIVGCGRPPLLPSGALLVFLIFLN